MPPFTARNIGANRPAHFITLEGESDSSHSKQPETFTNPERFLLDELHLPSEDLKSFHNLLFNSSPVTSVRLGTARPLQKLSPFARGPSPGLGVWQRGRTSLCGLTSDRGGEAAAELLSHIGVGSSSPDCANTDHSAALWNSPEEEGTREGFMELLQLQSLPRETSPKSLTSFCLKSFRLGILKDADFRKSRK